MYCYVGRQTSKTISGMRPLLLCLILTAGSALGINRIQYPKDDGRPENCILEDGSLGYCRNIKECSSVLTYKNGPKVCYYERFEEFVCCPYYHHLLDKLTDRPSDKDCRHSYLRWHHIVHGEPTLPGEFEYMVAIGWKTDTPNKYDYKCGGVLIAEDSVLTAAHCADDNGIEPAVILYGGDSLNSSRYSPTNIAEIIQHPKYDPEFVYNDIAIIKLETHFHLELHRIACLWGHYELKSADVQAVGYGHTKFAGKSSNQLLKANLRVTTNTNCQSHYGKDFIYPDGIVDTQICATDPEEKRDTCQGDSGGPIIMPVDVRCCDESRFYVVGITSFGQGCAGGPPSVYTRVSAYIDWIESVVWPNAYKQYTAQKS